MPQSPGEIVDVYRQAITPRTRVISMCHMTNTNGMILPVRDVAELARPRNILVAVDGAQTAGMFPFDLREFQRPEPVAESPHPGIDHHGRIVGDFVQIDDGRNQHQLFLVLINDRQHLTDRQRVDVLPE